MSGSSIDLMSESTQSFVINETGSVECEPRSVEAALQVLRKHTSDEIRAFVVHHFEKRCCPQVTSLGELILNELEATRGDLTNARSMELVLRCVEDVKPTERTHLLQLMQVFLTFHRESEVLVNLKQVQDLDLQESQRKQHSFVCRICEGNISSKLLELHTSFCKQRHLRQSELQELRHRESELANTIKIEVETFTNRARDSLRTSPVNAQAPSTSGRKLSASVSGMKGLLMTFHFSVHITLTKTATLEDLLRLHEETSDFLLEVEAMEHDIQTEKAVNRFVTLATRVLQLAESHIATLTALENLELKYGNDLLQLGLSSDLYVDTPSSPVFSAPASPSMKKDTRAVTQTASIGDYSIVKTMTKGAFGSVFLARRKATGDLYCIKCISKEDSVARNNLGRVLREKEALATLRHPNIVPLFWAFQSKLMVYLVMEYEIGGDLFSLIDTHGWLDEMEVKFYAAETIEALCYVHSLGMVHRDIKPDNILISASGHIKLSDFGLVQSKFWSSKTGVARVSSKEDSKVNRVPSHGPTPVSGSRLHSRTRFFSVVGTPSYASPEIILNIGHSFTTDWWSFGCVVYEMLSGSPPFSGTSKEETFNNILSKNIPFIDRELSEEAEDLIDQLLRIDSSKRLGVNEIDDFKRHPFFAGVPWGRLLQETPPMVPEVSSDDDLKYFSDLKSINLEDIVPSEAASIDQGLDAISFNDNLAKITYKNVEALGQLNITHSRPNTPEKENKKRHSLRLDAQKVVTSLAEMNSEPLSRPSSV